MTFPSEVVADAGASDAAPRAGRRSRPRRHLDRTRVARPRLERHRPRPGPGPVERARELGAVDELGVDHLATVAFVATPVAAVAAEATALLAADGSGELVVTDVGGVKGPIVSQVSHPRFVGGHPMAGSEQEGPDGADPDLFAGATWVLTPTSQTDPAAFSKIQSVIGSFGADLVALAPDRHDELVAMVSHVPHLTAATIMGLAAEAADTQAALLRLAAGGFRDMTRVAAGSPAIWPDICRDKRTGDRPGPRRARLPADRGPPDRRRGRPCQPRGPARPRPARPAEPPATGEPTELGHRAARCGPGPSRGAGAGHDDCR